MTDAAAITPVINAAIGSAIVAYYWYINNQIDPTKPSEKFNLMKILPTTITGAIIGILSVVMGIEPLTSQNAAVQMAAYGLVTSVVETGLKTIVRFLNRQEG